MELVERALLQPAPYRERYLESACGGDPALFAEVLGRVQWEVQMGGFLCQPVLERQVPVEAPGADAPATNPPPIRSAPVPWKPAAAALLCLAFAALMFPPILPRRAVQPVPETHVLLVMLPATMESGSPADAQLTLADLAVQLTGIREGFGVISPTAVRAAHADTPEAAWSALGATHVLATRITREGASAMITDGKTGVPLREWSGTHAALPAALRQLATDVFHLPRLPPVPARAA